MNNLFHAFSTSFHFKTVHEHIIYCQISSRAVSGKLLHGKYISQMCAVLGIIFCIMLKTSSKFSQKQRTQIILLEFPSLLHLTDYSHKANRAGRSSHNKNLLSKCCLYTSLCRSGDTSVAARPIQKWINVANKALSSLFLGPRLLEEFWGSMRITRLCC